MTKEVFLKRLYTYRLNKYPQYKKRYNAEYNDLKAYLQSGKSNIEKEEKTVKIAKAKNQSGYATVDSSRSERGMFFQNLYNDAVTGNMDDGYTVDYEKVKIARGLLLPTYSMTCSVLGAQHKCSYSWTDNSGQGDAESTDKICVNLYNPTKGVSMTFEDVATRAAEACQVQYSTSWAGDTVYNYIFWKKADGSCSDSQLVNFFVAE